MFRIFKGATADEAWQEVASAFRSNEGKDQQSRSGQTREILHAGISIADPRQRWVITRSPALNPAFALAEVVWILRGRNDSTFLNYFNSQLPKFAGTGKTYHGAYGFRLRNCFNLDQIDCAYRALKHNPSTRQIVLQIWDANVDFPSQWGKPAAPDIPCNVVSLLKIRDSKLEWTQIMRSNDVFRGFPHNVVQFTALQEILAGWLAVGVGSYNHFSDSLHVYKEGRIDDLPFIQKSFSFPTPSNTDDLALTKPLSDKMFKELERCIEIIISSKTSSSVVLELPERANLTQPYLNILLVLCAEGLRRRKQSELAIDLMTQCSNEAFNIMFQRWISRSSKRTNSVLLSSA
jgi:thymidylate synthase